MPLCTYLHMGPRCRCWRGMLMNREELQALANLPLDEPRSRLEPYREIILRWRRQGRTYRRIRELLAENWSVTVSRQVLTRFIQRRSRPRHIKPEPEIEEPVISPTSFTHKTAQPSVAGQHSTDSYAEVRERMRKHKETPPPPKPRKIFEVPEEDDDEIKPLRMIPSNPKEK